MLRNGAVEKPLTRQEQWPAGWYRSPSGVAWSNEQAVSPTHSLCLDEAGPEPGRVAMWRSVAVDVVAGRSYELNWDWSYRNAADVDALLRFFDVDRKFISQERKPAAGSTVGFEAGRIRAAAPPGAAVADVCFLKRAGGAGAVFVDDIALTGVSGGDADRP